MNNNFSFLAAFVAGLLLAGLFTVQGDTPQRDYPNTEQVFSGTSGAAATHDLTGDGTSYDWEICNTNTTSTNTLSLKICHAGDTLAACASNAAIVVRGNFCYSKKDIPAFAFIVTAVSGTPDYQLIAHYRNQ